MNASLIAAEELTQIEKSAQADGIIQVAHVHVEELGAVTREPTKRWSNSIGIALTIAIHALVVLLLLSSRPHVEVGLPPIAARVISDQSIQADALEVPQTRPELNTPKVTMVAPDIAIAESNAPVMSVAAAAPSSPASSSQSAERADMVEPRFDADYLNNPPPIYPRLSRRHREQGVVMLRVHVLPNGAPDRIELQTSSGFALLDEAALEAVRKWKFIPAQAGGKAMAAWVNVPIEFSLNT
ncbi:MAG: energy transducer TonB [Spongiibacteraceae bacterium]